MQTQRMAGLLVVIVLHGVVLYGLWQQRLLPVPEQAATIFVNFIAPPQAEQPPKPVKLAKPQQPVQPMPLLQPVEQATPAAPTVPAPALVEAVAPAAPPPTKPVAPLTLPTELSVVCPERTPPSYPHLSRRLGEQGKAVLRVELDEQGRISAARVVASSGYDRLDETALAAVRNWRCQPAQRDGQPVRAVALQPFNFTLGGP